MKVSKLFWHKSSSGKSLPGIVPVIVICGFCIYLSFMLVSGTPEAPKKVVVTSEVDISEITTAVTTGSIATEEQDRIQAESVSTRRSRGAGLSSNLGFHAMEEPDEVVSRNSINTIMSQLMADGPAPVERRMINDEPMIPSYVEQREILPTSGTVITESKPVADVEIVGFSQPIENEEITEVYVPSGFESNNFLPRGFHIPVILLNRFETGDLDTTAEFAVTKDVLFQNKLILERGTRILASGSTGAVREQISFNADMILYPDGRELNISATIKSPNGQTGLKGEYVAPPIEANLLSYSPAIITALATMATETEDKAEVIASDGTTVTQDVTQATPYSTQNAIVDAFAEVATQRTGDMALDYLEQNLPYVKLKRGTQGYFLLNSAVDFTNAAVGGSYRAPLEPENTEELVREAVSNYYTYGTLGNNGDLPDLKIPAPSNTPMDIPGLRN